MNGALSFTIPPPSSGFVPASCFSTGTFPIYLHSCCGSNAVSRTSAEVSCARADAGKVVYYWLRWVSRLGERGPWSVQVSAMVVG